MARRQVDYFVYFLKTDTDPGFVKIGTSKSPFSRIPAIQTNCPYKLETLAVVHCPTGSEWFFHEIFEEYHHRGEWFHAHPRLIEFIGFLGKDGKRWLTIEDLDVIAKTLRPEFDAKDLLRSIARQETVMRCIAAGNHILDYKRGLGDLSRYI